jgi:hypothetical protein
MNLYSFNKIKILVGLTILILFMGSLSNIPAEERKIYSDDDLNSYKFGNKETEHNTTDNKIAEDTEQGNKINSRLTSEDLEFIRFLQDQGIKWFPEGSNINNLSHTDIVYAKEAFKRLFGIEYETAKKPDSRFSSPERTWDTYKQALIAGDFELAESCLTPDFAKKHIEILKALGNEIIKKIALGYQPIQKIVQDDHSAKYRLRQKEIDGAEETYPIYFGNIFGNWKIVQM